MRVVPVGCLAVRPRAAALGRAVLSLARAGAICCLAVALAGSRLGARGNLGTSLGSLGLCLLPCDVCGVSGEWNEACVGSLFVHC